ncbi:MAG: NAD(P)H-dependent oxidoreductase [Cyanobacteria bacterium J06639_1]
MAKVLRIDTSPRTEGSHSRELADFFEKTWLSRFPNDEIIARDLTETVVPHLNAFTISAMQTPDEKLDGTQKTAVALSDELIDELFSVDAVLVSAPMYNFSVPSVLKAYIDHIVRAGKTFSYSPSDGYAGLLKIEKGFTITAAGGVYEGTPFASFNFLNPYLKALWTFLGVANVTDIALEGTTLSAEEVAQREQAARDRIQSVIAA